VPVEFLTDEQAESYGTFTQEPTRPELERFFFLDDEDRRLIGKRRGDYSRLGFALQVCTVRYVGLFLQDPLAVPWSAVEYLAEQLGVTDASCVKRYTEREKTAYEHAWEIQEAFGYHPYEDREWGRKFRTFLYGRAWTHAEGPVALFNHADNGASGRGADGGSGNPDASGLRLLVRHLRGRHVHVRPGFLGSSRFAVAVALIRVARAQRAPPDNAVSFPPSAHWPGGGSLCM
jgi:hypothetical protein